MRAAAKHLELDCLDGKLNLGGEIACFLPCLWGEVLLRDAPALVANPVLDSIRMFALRAARVITINEANVVDGVDFLKGGENSINAHDVNAAA